MGEQPVSFRFENSIGRFLTLLLMSSAVGSALGGITGAAMMILANIIFGNNTMALSLLGVILFVLSFLLIVGLIVVSSLKTWFWSLTFDSQGIVLKPIVGDQITILSHEIKGIKRQGELIVFKTIGEDLSVDLTKFPLKERVIFNYYRQRWPFQKLADDEKEGIVVLEKMWGPKNGFVEIDLNAGYKNRVLGIVVSGCISVSLLVFSIVFGSSLFTSFALLIAGLLLWMLWGPTSPYILRVDSDGIHYQKSHRSITLPWSDVEAVFFEVTNRTRFPEQRFYVWSKNRQAQIPRQTLGNKAFSELLKSIYILDKYYIPYEVKFPEWLTRN